MGDNIETESCFRGDSMLTLQEIITSIERLPTEDREYLFEFLQKQRI